MSFFQHGTRRKPYTDAQLDALIKRERAKNDTAARGCGKKVWGLGRLAELASERRSVFCLGCFGLKPASVIMSLQASIVQRMLADGRIHEYHPQPKRTKKLDAERLSLLEVIRRRGLDVAFNPSKLPVEAKAPVKPQRHFNGTTIIVSPSSPESVAYLKKRLAARADLMACAPLSKEAVIDCLDELHRRLLEEAGYQIIKKS